MTYRRIDSTSSGAPHRFVSGIVDRPDEREPGLAHLQRLQREHADDAGPRVPGRLQPGTHTATWTDIDNGTGPIGDLPVTGIARDATTGTLYVSTDFNVLADTPAENGSFDGNWRPAADGLPQVEVAGVTLDQKTGRCTPRPTVARSGRSPC